MTSLPKRKHPRLKNYDYSENGAYFITICTKNKAHILSRIIPSPDVGRDDPGAPPVCVQLTKYGEIVDGYIHSIERAYPHVYVDHSVIMPNHVHLILRIAVPEGGAPRSSRPTVSQIIGAFKHLSNHDAGRSLWQTSFHDHVIRDKDGYNTIHDYITHNPSNWENDCFYLDNQEVHHVQTPK